MIVTLHATGHHCRHETPTHSSARWAAGEKYRVTANYVVIYDAEQPTEELGRMNRGNRFEVIGKTGNRLVLNYKGKKGLIAPYHCEPVPHVVAYILAFLCSWA